MSRVDILICLLNLEVRLLYEFIEFCDCSSLGFAVRLEGGGDFA